MDEQELRVQERLAALGVHADWVETRGSETYLIEVMLNATKDGIDADDESDPIYQKLETAGLTTLLGGHCGDHGHGISLLAVVSFYDRKKII